MTEVRIEYHYEDGSVWADSPDLSGFVASGADLAEVRDLVKEGVPFYLDADDVDIVEQSPSGSAVVDVRNSRQTPELFFFSSDARATGWMEHVVTRGSIVGRLSQPIATTGPVDSSQPPLPV